MDNKLPFVSAIIVFKNEEKYIEKCLISIIEQDYPIDKYEILLIDGMSNDRTKAIVDEVLKKNNRKIIIRYLYNSKQSLASGWNLAIKEALGNYVFRIDAHGYLSKDFIINNVEVMKQIGDAVCVGGTIETECSTKMGKRIAMVLSSPFGVGNSKFRYTQKAQYVDTVAFGLYKKEIFDKIGYFDENLKRNQDNDMHKRIHDFGGKFYLDPKIKSTYIAREDIKSFLQQAIANGNWNMKLLTKDIGALRLRHFIPLFFVMTSIFLLVLGLKFKIFLLILGFILICHLLLGVICGRIKTNSTKDLLILPGLFISLHLFYGLGSLMGISNILLEKRKNE